MPKITTKSFRHYEEFLNDVYGEGLTEAEALEFFSNLPIAPETIIVNQKNRTLGKLVRKYDQENFLNGYSNWVMDS